MAKCVNCAWFPWKPGADFSGLPAMRCHPKTKPRRWIKAGVEAEISCDHYEAVELESETPDDVTEVKAVEPAPESDAPETPTAKPAPKAKPKSKSKPRSRRKE